MWLYHRREWQKLKDQKNLSVAINSSTDIEENVTESEGEQNTKSNFSGESTVAVDGQDTSKYPCNLCGRQFSKFQYLDVHMKAGHKNTDFNNSKKERSLKHTNCDDSIRCTLCKINFKSSKYLQVHVNNHHKDEMHLFDLKIEDAKETFECSKCNQSFLSENILSYHQRNHHHVTKTPSNCSECGEVFEWEENIETKISLHMKKFHNQQAFCKLCDKQFQEVASFVGHKKSVHSEEINLFEIDTTEMELQYECQECKKSFASEHSLKYHVTYQHKIGDRTASVKCKQCDKQFEWGKKRKATIRNHMKTVHGQAFSKDYTCKLCYQDFNYTFNLKIHQNKYHKDDLHFLEADFTKIDLKYECSKCKVAYISDNILQYHNVRRHGSKSEKEALNITYEEENPNQDVEETLETDVRKEAKAITNQDIKKEAVQEATDGDINLHGEQNLAKETEGEKENSLIKEKSDKTKQFQCDQCNLVLSTKSNLQRHKVKLHPDDGEGLLANFQNVLNGME